MNLRGYLTNEMPDPRDLALDETHERSFLKASAAVLASCFPNPNRSGCPDSSVLRQIAANKLRLRDAAPWMKHLGSCSACYQDFERHKEAARRRKVVRLVYSMAACVALTAIVVSVVLWNSSRKQLVHGDHGHDGGNVNTTTKYVPFVLDLRDAAQVRGPNGSSHSVMRLPRMPLHVLAYLPLGSDSGEYVVSMKSKGKPVWSSTAAAQMREKRMVAEFDDDLTVHPPGRYVLELSSKAGIRLTQNIDLAEPEKRK